MKPSSNREASDRGAVLVHVAIVLVALMGLSTFVVDSGVMWTSRRQAQNVADAAALAIAISLGHDKSPDPDHTALLSAQKVIEANRVWGEVPVYDIPLPFSTYKCPPESFGWGVCGTVKVFRDTEHSNPLPMFFGRLVGRDTQNVWATATAIAQNPNATDCLRPFAIPDLSLNAGTGLTVLSDYGTELVLRPASGGPPAAGSFRFVDIVGGGGGGGVMGEANILGCTADVYGIGDNLGGRLQPSPDPDTVDLAVHRLIGLDVKAEWDALTESIIKSCVDGPACPQYDASGTAVISVPNATVSPRVIALPVFDPTNPDVNIVNVVGFFVEGYGPTPGEIHGRLVSRPGLLVKSKGKIGDDASFLDKIINLVR